MNASFAMTASRNKGKALTTTHNLRKVEDCQGKLAEGISIVPGVSIGAEIAGPRVVTCDGAADGDTSHFLATQSGNPGHGAGYRLYTGWGNFNINLLCCPRCLLKALLHLKT